MKQHLKYFFLLPACPGDVTFFLHVKINEQLDSISNQPGVYDMFPGNAFLGDTVKITGKFNHDPDLRFFFKGRPARIVGKGTTTAYPTGSMVYTDIPIPLEYYLVIVPDSISGSVPVTASLEVLPFLWVILAYASLLHWLPGNVLVSTYAGVLRP